MSIDEIFILYFANPSTQLDATLHVNFLFQESLIILDILLKCFYYTLEIITDSNTKFILLFVTGFMNLVTRCQLRLVKKNYYAYNNYKSD